MQVLEEVLLGAMTAFGEVVDDLDFEDIVLQALDQVQIGYEDMQEVEDLDLELEEIWEEIPAPPPAPVVQQPEPVIVPKTKPAPAPVSVVEAPPAPVPAPVPVAVVTADASVQVTAPCNISTQTDAPVPAPVPVVPVPVPVPAAPADAGPSAMSLIKIALVNQQMAIQGQQALMLSMLQGREEQGAAEEEEEEQEVVQQEEVKEEVKEDVVPEPIMVPDPVLPVPVVPCNTSMGTTLLNSPLPGPAHPGLVPVPALRKKASSVWLEQLQLISRKRDEEALFTKEPLVRDKDTAEEVENKVIKCAMRLLEAVRPSPIPAPVPAAAALPMTLEDVQAAVRNGAQEAIQTALSMMQTPTSPAPTARPKTSIPRSVLKPHASGPHDMAAVRQATKESIAARHTLGSASASSSMDSVSMDEEMDAMFVDPRRRPRAVRSVESSWSSSCSSAAPPRRSRIPRPLHSHVLRLPATEAAAQDGMDEEEQGSAHTSYSSVVSSCLKQSAESLGSSVSSSSSASVSYRRDRGQRKQVLSAVNARLSTASSSSSSSRDSDRRGKEHDVDNSMSSTASSYSGSSADDAGQARHSADSSSSNSSESIELGKHLQSSMGSQASSAGSSGSAGREEDALSISSTGSSIDRLRPAMPLLSVGGGGKAWR